MSIGILKNHSVLSNINILIFPQMWMNIQLSAVHWHLQNYLLHATHIKCIFEVCALMCTHLLKNPVSLIKVSDNTVKIFVN